METIKVKSSEFNLKDTLECGQVFRFFYDNGKYRVCSKDKSCMAYETDGLVVIECDDAPYFRNYFDLDRDYGKINSHLRSFPELSLSAETGKGIRLLRQDPFEMIISFIISANNNIPRIKKIIEKICGRAGKNMGSYYAFPEREDLLKLTKEDFTACGAGYRDEYLFSAVRTVDEDYVKNVIALDTEHAIKELLKVKGVGPKVANCIALFGLSKWETFPVDTWMEQALGTEELNTPVKIHDFYLTRYGEYAGLAQQYIFHYKRNIEGKV